MLSLVGPICLSTGRHVVVLIAHVRTFRVKLYYFFRLLGCHRIHSVKLMTLFHFGADFICRMLKYTIYKCVHTSHCLCGSRLPPTLSLVFYFRNKVLKYLPGQVSTKVNLDLLCTGHLLLRGVKVNAAHIKAKLPGEESHEPLIFCAVPSLYELICLGIEATTQVFWENAL